MSTRLPNFCLGAKDPPAPPPSPLSQLRHLCLILLEICPENLAAKQLGFLHWLRTRARKRAKERFGLGVKTENEFDENELVIRDVRLGVHLFCLWFFLEYYSWCGFSSRCS